jgi:hypothetical protein
MTAYLTLADFEENADLLDAIEVLPTARKTKAHFDVESHTYKKASKHTISIKNYTTEENA